MAPDTSMLPRPPTPAARPEPATTEPATTAATTALMAPGASETTTLAVADSAAPPAPEAPADLNLLGGACMIVELDLVSEQSIAQAFATIRHTAGEPDVVIYNAGYLEGRELPPDKELLEYIPTEMFETAQHLASRGPFLVAREVLPVMRERGSGPFLLTNNASLRGRKRLTGQSLYYPRVMMRTLAPVLTEEYSVHGVHVANAVIDGLIDSPGTARCRSRRNALRW